MTVCVAAISEGRIVVGASDRMLTTGDISFEPPQTKIYRLTNSIAVMLAGDAALNHEILARGVNLDIAAYIQADPDAWVSVQAAAASYRSRYQESFLERVENVILAPLNLDRNTFLTKQKKMAPGLVTQLAADIVNFQPSADGVDAIFAGVDDDGPHLYRVEGSNTNCYDSIGFVAIGGGRWHAESQLMFAQHSPGAGFVKTMMLVYWAKKRAEVTPGVGRDTDMFFIGDPGTFTRVRPEVIARLDEIWANAKERERQTQLEAERSTEEFFKEALAAAAAAPKVQEAHSTEIESGEEEPTEEDNQGQ